MEMKYRIDYSDVKKARRLKAAFPKDYREIDFIPIMANEETVVEYLQKNAPYYALTYGGWLASFVPKIGGLIAMMINRLAKYYGIRPKIPG